MKRTYPLLTLGLAGCMLVGGTPVSWAAEAPVQAVPISAAIAPQAPLSTIAITSKDVTKENALLIAKLSIPVLSGMKDTRYQAEVNDIIERHAMEELAALEQQAQQDADEAKQSGGYEFRPYGFDVRYEVKAAGRPEEANRVSLKVMTYTYTGGANGMSRVDAYNFTNEAEAKPLTLRDLFGDSYKQTIDGIIGQAIQAKPEDYFKDAFQGISDAQTFYVENGEAVIVFGKYEIAPGAAGNPEFRIPLAGGSSAAAPAGGLAVNGKPLPSGEAQAYVNDAGVTMLPLRAVTEALGYKLTWNAEKRQAELSKGAQWTAVQEGKDSYTINKMAPVQLGTAPILHTEKLYVPLAFFSDILKLDVTKANGGGIHIQAPK
ncbi:stalk domain-containing protein [Paenibacillus rigui]|uniref:Copper amine oxidase n=1 Tax=Paenibacillus rigui TaxID=554312 RepID=A0A229UKZ2_9BACL|nr:DUF3298 domain-containing protein [Paenibacillus rigui]OXM83579.1 copper amine oxidase [Paenibacillus rigui]